MSNKVRPQYADQKGEIVEGFDRNALIGEGATVPTDGTAGFAPGCIWFKRAGSAGGAHYINEGSATSCAFKALQSQNGLAVRRGQTTTSTASDTIVTGLATVVSAVACMDDAPVIGCDRAQASIGDQAGTPAAGSILVRTYKPTSTTDTTPIAATTFSKKVNWIAVGTA